MLTQKWSVKVVCNEDGVSCNTQDQVILSGSRTRHILGSILTVVVTNKKEILTGLFHVQKCCPFSIITPKCICPKNIICILFFFLSKKHQVNSSNTLTQWSRKIFVLLFFTSIFWSFFGFCFLFRTLVQEINFVLFIFWMFVGGKS